MMWQFTDNKNSDLFLFELLFCTMYIENGFDFCVELPPLPLADLQVLAYIPLYAPESCVLYLVTRN